MRPALRSAVTIFSAALCAIFPAVVVGPATAASAATTLHGYALSVVSFGDGDPPTAFLVLTPDDPSKRMPRSYNYVSLSGRDQIVQVRKHLGKRLRVEGDVRELANPRPDAGSLSQALQTVVSHFEGPLAQPPARLSYVIPQRIAEAPEASR